MVSARAVEMIAVAHGWRSSSSALYRLRPSILLGCHWSSPVRGEVAAEPIAVIDCVHEPYYGRVHVH